MSITEIKQELQKLRERAAEMPIQHAIVLKSYYLNALHRKQEAKNKCAYKTAFCPLAGGLTLIGLN